VYKFEATKLMNSVVNQHIILMSSLCKQMNSQILTIKEEEIQKKKSASSIVRTG